MRSWEFYELPSPYNPRVQLADTIALVQIDGTTVNRLVWGINKGKADMVLTLWLLITLRPPQYPKNGTHRVHTGQFRAYNRLKGKPRSWLYA